MKDLSGLKFGRLTTLRFVRWHNYPSGRRHTVWECVCDCGRKLEVISASLKSGNTESCGCLRREVAANGHTTHGKAFDRIYRIWIGMQQRCGNPKTHNYSRYGGRGIQIVWKSFEDFYRDMSESYRDDLTIDRINGDGNYCKENCRWATITQQNQNRNYRRNV